MSSTHNKLYHPNIVWFGVWLAFFLVMVVIASWQNDLYRRDNRTRFSQMQLNAVRTILPYAAAYLEQQDRPDLLQKIVDADLGPFALVLTDKFGKIKYINRTLSSGKIDADFLKKQDFFYIYQDLALHQSSVAPATTGQEGSPASAAPKDGAEILGRIYPVAKDLPSFLTTLQQASMKLLTPADSVLAFSLLSYILVLVGFAGICAITAKFQSHFQEVQERQYESELESQGLRIEVLESNIKSADLRLQLLDQSQEKAQAILDLARNTITGLDSAILYETSRNEELQEKLQKAKAEKNDAIDTIQAIELDREKIAKELKELEAQREVEQMNYPEASKEKSRRPKEFLWLNLAYKNLSFSKRALENIIDLQNSADIFPSLPDALAALNATSMESLMNGGALPSRSVVRYTQSLPYHDGDFWEYRFSKDGRLFFGVSKSRTWNIDTILLKRKFSLNRHKYEKYLEQTLGKDNDDLKAELTLNWRVLRA
jgi:hypothetical protein